MNDFNLYKKQGMWVLDAAPHINAVANRVFVKTKTAPFRGEHTSKPLSLSLSPDNCKDLLWLLQRHPAKMSQADRDFLESQASIVDRIAARMQDLADGVLEVDPPDLEKPPYPYQMDAVKLFSVSNRLLLGDELGLGKTVTAIACTRLPGALPACIVVPTHLRTQWVDKLYEFLFLPSVRVIKSMKGDDIPEGTEYIVTSYNLLEAWAGRLIKFGIRSLVMDEVHGLRSEDTAKRRAALILSEHVQYCMGATGTLIYGYGIEAHSVLDAVAPGLVGTKNEFAAEWCGGGKVVSRPVDLGKYLRERGLMLRRTYVDIGKKPGDVVTDVIHIEASLEELAKIEKIATLLAKQALTGYGLSSGQSARELDSRLRHATGMAKVGAAAHFILETLASEQRVLVGVWHHDVKNAIARELVKQQGRRLLLHRRGDRGGKSKVHRRLQTRTWARCPADEHPLR